MCSDPGETETEGWNGAAKPGKCFPLKPGCPGSQPEVIAASWLFSPCQLLKMSPSSTNTRNFCSGSMIGGF